MRAVSRSIVVVCHSSQRWLGRCLESGGAEAEEVVLVDNGSVGETASAVGRRQGAVVVRLPQNVAALVARAETFRRIGGLAESFFACYEDTDWCLRARLAGLTIRYDPSAVVHHVGGATTGGPAAPRVRRLAARNRIHTLARNAPLSVLRHELRSPVDRPSSGMALPLTRGLLERRLLSPTGRGPRPKSGPPGPATTRNGGRTSSFNGYGLR